MNFSINNNILNINSARSHNNSLYSHKIAFGDVEKLSPTIAIQAANYNKNSDFSGWADYINANPELNMSLKKQGQAIQSYITSVQRAIQDKVGVNTSVVISKKYKNIEFEAYSTVEPKEINYLYERLALNKSIALERKKNGEKTIPHIVPREVILKFIEGSKVGLACNNIIQLDLDNISCAYEHEFAHINECKEAYSFLDILQPKEKKLYREFEKAFVKHYDKVIKKIPTLRLLKKASFNLPREYDNRNRNLPLVAELSNTFSVVDLTSILDKPYKPNAFKRLPDVFVKLNKFYKSICHEISSDVHHTSTPDEIKAEAWQVRASGKPLRPDYLLPISVELEKDLAKLGMLKPHTYDILPQNYLAQKAKQKGANYFKEFQKINFGEELVKRLSPELKKLLK